MSLLSCVLILGCRAQTRLPLCCLMNQQSPTYRLPVPVRDQVYPVKRHRGEPGHTRDTRDTRTRPVLLV